MISGGAQHCLVSALLPVEDFEIFHAAMAILVLFELFLANFVKFF